MVATLSPTQPVAPVDPASIPFEERRQDHLHEMRRRVPAHLERLAWPAERLRTEREARLRDLIRVARDRSPWHRDRLGDLNPDDVGEGELARLPVMTKRDLMANFDRIVTEPRLTLDRVEGHLFGLTTDSYLLDRFHAVASGGSSGQRGVFVWDWESWADCYLSCLRYTIREQSRNPEQSRRPM